ncbi:MAG TPA: M20/M25/M40 family metallo-hydrolase [Gemmatimonadales bacterium]|nr:M20/M25/M40 family metallo-hydrolase [Gemmatimonadales bacterium]
MASTSPTELALLRDLVATPSVSGTEEGVAALVEEWARAAGLAVVRDETAVVVRVAGRGAGPRLAFISHLDTVPAGEGWTRDPFAATIEGDRLYGRGSGDAKASVAAMLTAAQDLAAARGPARGELVVVLGYGEETKHTSMPAAVARHGPFDAAVVGEPTNLDAAVAQRGLMMVDLVAHGDQRHAGYASEGGFVNAVSLLAADLLALPGLAQSRAHPVLGHPTLTATMVHAGVSRNVTPPSASAVLDIRSTPAWTHRELGEELRRHLRSEVTVTSERLVPCETPAGSRLLAAATRVRPALRTFGSPTCSDWVFVRDADAIKCGPGTSRRSHTPDEYVDLPEVGAARAFYAALAGEYLG